MIADRLAKFRLLLDARDRLDAGRAAAEQLAPVLATLADAAAEIAPLAARYRLLRKVGVVAQPPPDAAALLRVVGSFRDRLVSAAGEGVTVPKQTLGRFRNLAEAVRDGLREITSRAWADWVGTRIPHLSDDDLRLAEQDAGFAEVVALVRDRRDDARRLLDRPPDSEEEFAASQDDLASLRAAVVRLPDVSAEPEVATFLAAVADGRATLTHVTPRVIDWLGQRGRAEGFAVFRTTGSRQTQGEAEPCGSPPTT